MIKISIGGDVCPMGQCEKYFIKGDSFRLFNDLLDPIKEADISIVNLECPLIDTPNPILKTGPILGAASDCIKGIKNAGIDIVNLANNHIMDHGAEGLKNTLNTCQHAEIATVGAGRNLAEARQILIQNVRGTKVGILACAEHEYSIASKKDYGANPLDPVDYIRSVRSYRDQLDFLILLIHGGNEFYAYPSPRMQKLSHFMLEEGADAIIWQHTHCPGCYELYNNKYIVYGQGNLIFEGNHKRDLSWYQGFLIELNLDHNRNINLDLVPYLQSKNGIGSHRMSKSQEKDFLSEISDRSANIKKEGFIENQWLNFCKSRRDLYLSTVLGHSRMMRFLNKKLHIARYIYSKNTLLGVGNTVRCESHRDVLVTLLNSTNLRRK